MKGYIYISSPGTDPGKLDNLNDPDFGGLPTLGACVPNIRRFVSPGDFVFVVSGSTAGVQQYVVGGFEVAEKIDALAAYKRFPENRLSRSTDGKLSGNIIVNADGTQSSLDRHDAGTFARRIKNFIVGRNPVVLQTPAQIARGRDETLERLSLILDKPRANRAFDLLGRASKLSAPQVEETLDWLRGIKAGSP